jgi:hypothetical protein
MRGRTGLPRLVLAAGLLCYAAPSRAGDEPVATAPIPPPTIAAPATVPKAPRATRAPAIPTPAKPAVSKSVGPGARGHERASTDRRKPVLHDAAEDSKRVERSKSGNPAPERRPERQQAAASREQTRSPPDYRPAPYYREYMEQPPFAPPWYDRGPPFAGMPYGPRGPMPPW